MFLHLYFAPFGLLLFLSAFSANSKQSPTWQCDYFSVKEHSNGTMVEFGQFSILMTRVGILYWDELTAKEWIGLLNSEQIVEWANKYNISEMFNEILLGMEELKGKSDEKEMINYLLMNKAIEYRAIGGEGGKTIRIGCRHWQRKNRVIMFTAVGDKAMEKGEFEQKWPSKYLFDNAKDFDFLAKWEVESSTKLDLAYIPGKMRRKSYLFWVIIGLEADEDLAKKFVEKEGGMDPESENFEKVLNVRYAQMMAAFKLKFGFSKRARQQLPGEFPIKNYEKCPKNFDKNEENTKMDYFCQIRLDEDLQEYLKYKKENFGKYSQGWTVNENSGAFKLAIEQLELRSKNEEFSVWAPDVIYREMSEEEKKGEGHEKAAELIFPEEYEDPDYPKLFLS